MTGKIWQPVALAALIGSSCGFSGAAMAKTAGQTGPEIADNHVVEATALARVYGGGQELVAVALEYDRPVSGTGLDTSTFRVAGRTVTRVFAADSATATSPARGGRFVIIALSRKDKGALLTVDGASPADVGHGAGPGPGGPQHDGSQPGGPGKDGGPGHGGGPVFKAKQIFRTASAQVVQTGVVTTLDGRHYEPGKATIETSRAVDPVVDSFRVLTFEDPATGQTLRYNLYVPKDYDPKKSYPLVMFLHDAGVLSEDVGTTLKQGLGAVAWASPEDQARHPAFVLAPQYDHVTNSDKDTETAVDLVEALSGQYSIDPRRLYMTGQSMGGSLLIRIAVAHPAMFAASYIVASQADDPETVAPLAGQKLWIVVSQGDERAYPGENLLTGKLEKLGTPVSRAVWSGTASPAEFAADVAQLEAQGSPVNYVALQKGTVVPPGQNDNPGSNHINTWRIAYDIPGIRDWIMRQHN